MLCILSGAKVHGALTQSAEEGVALAGLRYGKDPKLHELLSSSDPCHASAETACPTVSSTKSPASLQFECFTAAIGKVGCTVPVQYSYVPYPSPHLHYSLLQDKESENARFC